MAIAFALLAGMFGVLQGGVNRLVAQSWGFSSALLLSGVGFVVFNLFLFAVAYSKPELLPESYRIQGSSGDIRWWWFLSGLFGFLLVGSIAMAIGQIGALEAFVFCVAAQLIASNAWDYFVEAKDPTPMRLIGTAITFVGVYITTR